MNSLRYVGKRAVRSVHSLHALTVPLNATSRHFSKTKPYNRGTKGRFSSSAAAPTAEKTVDKSKKNDSNIFLDNLGTIFLTTIAVIIGALVRSSYNGSNRLALRSSIELESELDPYEIDDLREANSEFKPAVFREIMTNVQRDFPTGNATYHEFVKSVRQTMRDIYGDAFTVELGHLLDRVVAAAFQSRGKSVDADEESLVFWLTTLSMAMQSDASDRIRVLYEALQIKNGAVKVGDVEEMVAALQDTCQLVSDVQTVATSVKFPTQQFRRAKPADLLDWEEGSMNDEIDLEGLAAILRSRSVCAWGECYLKKKPAI